MSQQVISSKKQEEKIKNRLVNIQFQESQNPNAYLPRYLNLQPSLKRKNSDFPELSDWTSNFDLPQKNLFIATKSKEFNSQQKDKKRMTFFNGTRYTSSLLSTPTKKASRLQLSPIVVKFNAKVLSLNLQQSKERCVRKIKEDPYITRYQSSSLIQNCKKSHSQFKNYKGAEVKELKFQGKQVQRMTGILKLIKKEVPYRSRPKKPMNPEGMNMTNLYF